MISGLPHLKIRPPTDEEIRTLPCTILTSGDPWDPRVLDRTLSDDPDWFNQIPNLDSVPQYDGPFDSHGDYKFREELSNEQRQPPPRRNPKRKTRSVRLADFDHATFSDRAETSSARQEQLTTMGLARFCAED